MNNEKDLLSLTLRDLFKTGIKENYEFALSLFVFELFYSPKEGMECIEETIPLTKVEIKELLDTELALLLERT